MTMVAFNLISLCIQKGRTHHRKHAVLYMDSMKPACRALVAGREGGHTVDLGTAERAGDEILK